MLWTGGSVAFVFGKGGSGVLANCSLCGTEATLFFSAGPGCSRFSAEACAILQALCWSRQHQQVCHFFFLFYLTLALSSPSCTLFHLSFYLKLCGRSGRNCLLSPPVLSGYKGSPGTRFSRETMQLMSWPDGKRYLHLLQYLVVSRFHSPYFSDWRRTVSSKFFDTQVPSISTEKLVLPRHARCVLPRLRCNGHSLLLSSYLFRIGRIENPSCSAFGQVSEDTSHLILHCPATDSLRRSLFADSLSIYDFWSWPWRLARLLGLHGLPPCLHLSEGIG